jgi:hypothetical protein
MNGYVIRFFCIERCPFRGRRIPWDNAYVHSGFDIVCPMTMSKGPFIPTGDVEIDRIRKEISETPTDPTNYEERLILLRAWRILLQRQGANLTNVYPVQSNIVQHVRNGETEAVIAEVEEFASLLEEHHLRLHEGADNTETG